MKCRKCGTEVEAPRTICPNCGTDALKRDDSVQGEKEFPMAWFNFQIYFAQWAGMVLCILSVPLVLRSTGSVLLAVCFVASAFFHYCTRQTLANYSSAGPKMLYAQYIIGEVVSILMGNFSLISIGFTALLVYLNYVYFKKRESLFY